MSILQRTFMAMYVRVFLLASAGIVFLSLLFRAFDEMGDFADVSVPTATFLKYLTLLVPGYLVIAFPLGVLVATLVVLGLASRHGELVAVQALGGSLRQATLVFVVAALVVSAAEYGVAEFLAPAATREASDVRETEILGRPRLFSLIGKSLWMRAEGGELVRFTVVDQDRVFDVSIFSFLENGDLSTATEAREGRWAGTHWNLHDVRVHRLTGDLQRTEHVETLAFPGITRPERVDAERLRPEQMTRQELAAYVDRLETAGFRTIRYRVSLAGRTSHPFMNLAMGLVATGLALVFRSAGGMRAAGLSVVVALLYWAGQSLTMSLGYSARLSPVIAAWAVPGVFTVAGLLLWIRSERP